MGGKKVQVRSGRRRDEVPWIGAQGPTESTVRRAVELYRRAERGARRGCPGAARSDSERGSWKKVQVRSGRRRDEVPWIGARTRPRSSVRRAVELYRRAERGARPGPARAACLGFRKGLGLGSARVSGGRRAEARRRSERGDGRGEAYEARRENTVDRSGDTAEGAR